MKKFLMTILVFAVAIVPLFSMIAMAYDYDNDARFELDLAGFNRNKQVSSGLKENSSIAYSKVRISADSDNFNGHIWVENADGTMISDKYEITNAGITYQLDYIDGVTFLEGATVYFFAEQSASVSKHIIGRSYPF